MSNKLALSPWLKGFIFCLIVLPASLANALAETKQPPLDEINPDYFSIKFVKTPLYQAFEMLSKLGNVSILLGKGVEGEISANIRKTNVDKAVRTIAAISGYSVEKTDNTYVVLIHEEAGRDQLPEGKQVKTLKVQYIGADVAATLLEKYLSRHGQITAIEERGLLVVEDQRSFMQRIESVLAQVDLRPRQILIEAKILEVTLQDDETFGIDWSSKSDHTNFGTTGLSSIGSSGFFLDYVSADLDVSLKALTENGRVRTLSTPKLLVLEDQEAEVIIGDRLGFKVTTTINEVTSESIEFIESGVILKVKAAVDNSERIMLNIHPEVSSGTIADGIPSLTTTEVTTQMIADSGQSIFIGGLIKNKTTDSKTGVPGLSRIPVVGNLFSRTEEKIANTETVVIIKPHLIEDPSIGRHAEVIRKHRDLLQSKPEQQRVPVKVNATPPRQSTQSNAQTQVTLSGLQINENR